MKCLLFCGVQLVERILVYDQFTVIIVSLGFLHTTETSQKQIREQKQERQENQCIRRLRLFWGSETFEVSTNEIG